MDSKTTKKPTQISPLWVVIGVLATIPIVYFFAHAGDPTFMGSTMGNWFATMVGVLIGIPIALYLSRWQEKQQTRREEEARQREALDRRTRLLTLVRQELDYNRHQLTLIQGSGDMPAKLFSHGGLKDELWSALSDGGELQWIGDLHLLDTLALAYHHLRRVIFFERLVLQSLSLPGGTVLPARADMTDILLWSKISDGLVLQSVERALKEIDETLAG